MPMLYCARYKAAWRSQAQKLKNGSIPLSGVPRKPVPRLRLAWGGKIVQRLRLAWGGKMIVQRLRLAWGGKIVQWVVVSR